MLPTIARHLMGSEDLKPKRVGLAFGLVIAAGMCTVVGSILAFFVTVNNTRFLA